MLEAAEHQIHCEGTSAESQRFNLRDATFKGMEHGHVTKAKTRKLGLTLRLGRGRRETDRLPWRDTVLHVTRSYCGRVQLARST